MKLTSYSLIVYCLLSFFSSVKAQDFDHNAKWLKGWTDFDPNLTDYPEAEEKIPNAITTDTFLSKDTVYLLSGDVYVASNANLTIEEGTIIRCDPENPAHLIVARGAKLIAVGTETNPIVFTSNKSAKSRKSGDWGGIIIAGNGVVNTPTGTGMITGGFSPQFSVYGGSNNEEQTTVLRNVRIEFAGNTAKRGEDASALSLLAVGLGSLIDNIMVSYSGQDSFNWNGGNANVNNVVSYKAVDDDYQISEGFKGNVDNLMAIRHPYITSPRGSYSIEINGFNKNSSYVSAEAVTDISISNATLVNLSDKTNYMHTTASISASNRASIYLNNSKISGFSDVVTFDSSYTSLATIRKAFGLDNSFFNVHGEGVKVAYKNNAGVLDILKYNRFTEEFADVQSLFASPISKGIPNFGLKKSKNTYMVMQ